MYLKIARSVLLIYILLVLSVLLNEAVTCPIDLLDTCANKNILVVIFMVSSYFVDYLLSTSIKDEYSPKFVFKVIAGSPYIIFLVFSLLSLISGSSFLIVEYILGKLLIISALFTLMVFFLNNVKQIRRMNFYFMLIMTISVGLFLLF